MVRSPYNRNRRRNRKQNRPGPSSNRASFDIPSHIESTNMNAYGDNMVSKGNLLLKEPAGNFVTFLPKIGGGSSKPRLGTREILAAFSKMPWLHAVVSKIGQAVGMTEWKAFVVLDSDKRAKRVRWSKLSNYDSRIKRIQKLKAEKKLIEIEDHPILDFLDMGNDALLGQNVISLTEEYLSLVGEAFWVIEKDESGVPLTPWPIPPHWIIDLPTQSHPFYRIRFRNKQADIPVTEVIPFLRPDPFDPYGRGIGFAKALGDELESDEYSAKHIKNFFLNQARPDIIISGDSLSRADTARLEERWLEKHKGFWNSFKPHFLNRKVDVKEVGQSFESMQMVELRKFERDIVLQVFGVSPEKFGVLTASNRSTITASDLFWTKDVIKPRVQLIRNTLQKHLVPMFDDRIILEFESPAVEDKQLELDVMRSMPAAYTINEWREKAELDKTEGGEKHILRAGELVVDINSETPVDPSLSNNSSDTSNTENNIDNQEEELSRIDNRLQKSNDIKGVIKNLLKKRISEKIVEHLSNSR